MNTHGILDSTIGLSIMGIAVTMKVKEDKNGEEKRERDQIEASMNFSSQKTISNIHSPKRTQRHR